MDLLNGALASGSGDHVGASVPLLISSMAVDKLSHLERVTVTQTIPIVEV